MKWKKIIGIIILLAVIAIVIFKLKSNKEKTQEKVYHFDKEKPIAVSVDTLKLQRISEANTYTGTFEPNKETKISSEVQGKINSVLVDVGSYVSIGQPVVQLDNSLLKIQLQSTQVQIEGLQDDVNRYTILANADAIEGIKLEKAQLGLRAAKMQKAGIQEQINKTIVRAPFGGVVTFKFSEVGAFAAPGVPLLQITDIGTLRFTVNVPENDLKQFHQNQTYRISADAYPETPLSGKVIMSGSKANMGNSFTVQLQVKNTNSLLIKSGMFGKVSLDEAKDLQGIIIPSSAIIETNGKAQVYLAKNGKAILQPVSVSKNIGENAVVERGLQAGDVVVTNGFINLFDGAKIISN